MKNALVTFLALEEDILSDKPFTSVILLPTDDNADINGAYTSSQELFGEMVSDNWGTDYIPDEEYRYQAEGSFRTIDEALSYGEKALKEYIAGLLPPKSTPAKNITSPFVVQVPYQIGSKSE